MVAHQVYYNETYATHGEALARLNAILAAYPEYGYGTSVRVTYSAGGWSVVGYRWSSCD